MKWEVSLTQKEVMALCEAIKAYPRDKIKGVAKHELHHALADGEPI